MNSIFIYLFYSCSQRRVKFLVTNYLIYRFVVAALLLSISVFCLSVSQHPNYWFIYLSHNGLILQTIHLGVAAALPVQLLLTPPKGEKLNIV